MSTIFDSTDALDVVFDVALNTLRTVLQYESTSAFLVYTHKSPKSQSNASQEIAINFTKWLNRVGSNLRSDRSPKGSDKGHFFRYSVDNGPVPEILQSQMCLLPHELRPDSVDKVIVCGSELLEEYIKTPFYQD